MITMNHRVARALPASPAPLTAATVIAAMTYVAAVLDRMVAGAQSAADRPASPAVTIADIQAAVARVAGVSLIEMYSCRRARSVARPRQVAMALAKEMTSKSLPAIGRAFGGRDHTTVMHAVKTIQRLRAEGDEDVRRIYGEARRQIVSATYPRVLSAG